ncbi:putative dehydratase protein [Roseibium sp. TrichSKD4]|nr:putative dehydratase protein [Roseibium sp. TrichSKD4]
MLDQDTLNWEEPFSWSNPDIDLLEALWTLQVARMEYLPDFWAWTDALVADLHNARTLAGTAVETDAIDCARFVTCMPAVYATRAAGQLGPCYDWIWTAVSPTHDRNQRVNNNTYTFLNFPHAPRNLFNRYLQDVSEFAGACFYVAYRFGGLDELTADVAPACWRVVSSIQRQNPAERGPVEAMSQMVIWAAYIDWPASVNWAADLVDTAARTQSLRNKLDIAMVFTTQANRFVEGTPQEWAARALSEWGSVMVEHERLQALAVAIEGVEDWRSRRAEVLEEISRLRASYLANLRSGESDLEVLELRAVVLNPLIFALVNWGEIDDVIVVLGAWYRANNVEPSEAELLVLVPTHNGGAAYLWPGGSWLTGTGDTATYDDLQRAASTALGSYFRGGDGDHSPDRYEDIRFDVIDASAGPRLEEAMAAHYRFEELRERLPADWAPRSVLIFPSGPEPLQAMLARYANVAAPLEISFQSAFPSRPIRRIAVWAGGPLHERFEIDAIRHVAERSGWGVDLHGSANPTRDDLRRFYENDEADVVWVISHGTHDPFAVGGSGLHMPDETLINLEEIRGWRIPTDGRRLLVLNSCSGASAQMRGGLSRIGLAQSLVSGHQAVVGHLWPVHWTTGLAFGAALAARLEDALPEQAALEAAQMLADPQQLNTFLEDRYLGCDDMLDRLRRSGEDLTSIVNWGCPVLLT